MKQKEWFTKWDLYYKSYRGKNGKLITIKNQLVRPLVFDCQKAIKYGRAPCRCWTNRVVSSECVNIKEGALSVSAPIRQPIARYRVIVSLCTESTAQPVFTRSVRRRANYEAAIGQNVPTQRQWHSLCQYNYFHTSATHLSNLHQNVLSYCTWSFASRPKLTNLMYPWKLPETAT